MRAHFNKQDRSPSSFGLGHFSKRLYFSVKTENLHRYTITLRQHVADRIFLAKQPLYLLKYIMKTENDPTFPRFELHLTLQFVC